MEQKWTDEIAKVEKEMSLIVGSMLATINNRANDWSLDAWKEFCCDKEKSSNIVSKTVWEKLPPAGWRNMIGSILLLRCEEAFCRKFGPAIILLEGHLSRFQMLAYSYCIDCGDTSCSCYEEFGFKANVCLDENLKQTPCSEYYDFGLVNIEIPSSYESNTSHFAHVGWLFCEAVAEKKKFESLMEAKENQTPK